MRDGNLSQQGYWHSHIHTLVLEVTMRDGNSSLLIVRVMKYAHRFRSDYEGWKQ